MPRFSSVQNTGDAFRVGQDDRPSIAPLTGEDFEQSPVSVDADRNRLLFELLLEYVENRLTGAALRCGDCRRSGDTESHWKHERLPHECLLRVTAPGGVPKHVGIVYAAEASGKCRLLCMFMRAGHRRGQQS